MLWITKTHTIQKINKNTHTNNYKGFNLFIQVGRGKEWGSYEKEGNIKEVEVLKVYLINNFFEKHNYIIM
jgi:hypothetical protein